MRLVEIDAGRINSFGGGTIVSGMNGVGDQQQGEAIGSCGRLGRRMGRAILKDGLVFMKWMHLALRGDRFVSGHRFALANPGLEFNYFRQAVIIRGSEIRSAQVLRLQL